jgi:hypothetical protein
MNVLKMFFSLTLLMISVAQKQNYDPLQGGKLCMPSKGCEIYTRYCTLDLIFIVLWILIFDLRRAWQDLESAPEPWNLLQRILETKQQGYPVATQCFLCLSL